LYVNEKLAIKCEALTFVAVRKLRLLRIESKYVREKYSMLTSRKIAREVVCFAYL